MQKEWVPLRALTDVQDWFDLCTAHNMRWDTADRAAHATQQLLVWLMYAPAAPAHSDTTATPSPDGDALH